MSPTEQTDWRSGVKQADDSAAAAMKEAARSSIAWEADVDIVYNSVLALNLEPKAKEFLVQAAKVGDRVYVHRRARPTMGGLSLIGRVMVEGTGLVTEAGKVEVYHVIPAVGVGQILNIPLKLVAYRAATN